MFSTSMKANDSIHFSKPGTDKNYSIMFVGLETVDAKCKAIWEINGNINQLAMDESFFVDEDCEITVICKSYDRGYFRCAIDSPKCWKYQIK